jgi:chromosome segregation ATPase
MPDEKIHKIELDVVKHTEQITNLSNQVEGYFDTLSEQHKTILGKLEIMPNEDRIIRLFAQEGEKLARGLIKRDDEQAEQLKSAKADIDAVKNEITATKKAMKYVHALIGTVCAGIGTYIGWQSGK